MDYDNDGILDFISGSYDPGDVYLFRGIGKGRYAAVEKILDKDGVPLVHHPEQLIAYEQMRKHGDESSDAAIRNRVASFGSWVAPVDWENDGDLDLLIGSFRGELFLRINEGSRNKPVYSPESIPVPAGGIPLKVYCHADPVVADWNEDGLWDLVVSSGDGSVGWYENIGTARSPRFGERQLLVSAKSESKFLTQDLEPGEQPGPGVRAQICVVDYDLDGHLDLVLGDYSNVRRLRVLDGGQRKERDATRVALEEARSRLRAAGTDAKEHEALQERVETLTKQEGTFYTEAEGRRTSHVWLYLRRPAHGGAPADKR
ncbi:MAG TPA: VCBS repeat-containing protein [Planctomycetota bacterium]|nr:VCBS repeat-containing protein [Planctomycetota bacterium]